MKKYFIILFLNKRIYSSLFIGFLLSVCLSIYYSKVFDSTLLLDGKSLSNGIIGKKDAYRYIEEANQHIANFKNNNLIHSEKPEYTSTWLHSKILAIYIMLSSPDILLNNEKVFLEFNKINFFIFQSIIFYLSLFFFFLNIKDKYATFRKNESNSRLVFFCIVFIAFEPTILQYHSSLYTESIFISLNIIIFSLLINLKISYTRNFLIGFLVGIAYLQRGIALYYFIPISIYYFFAFKKNFLKPILFFFIGFLLILIFLGFSNYLRTNKLFIKPLNSYIVIPRYFVVQLLYPEVYKTNLEDSRRKFYQGDFDLNKINGEIKKQNILQKFHKSSLNEIFRFPKESFFVIIKNLPKSLVLDPLEIFNTYKFNLHQKTANFQLEYKIFRIIYSGSLYFIIFLGFICFCRKKENIPVTIFIIVITLYFLLITVIDGATQRIFLPSIIYLSIFFSSGINSLFYKKN